MRRALAGGRGVVIVWLLALWIWPQLAEARAAAGFSRDVYIPGSGIGFKSRTHAPHAPCTHLGDQVNGISARAAMATTVFEGKARSRSPGPEYGVTFVVQQVHKSKLSIPLSSWPQVRLQFREKKGAEPVAAPQGLCAQSYNYTRRRGDRVPATIKRGGKYIVFVTGMGPHNFSLLGEPVLRTRKNLQAVRDVLCHRCMRPAGVSGLKDVKVKVDDRVRLVCRSKGNPLPALSWYKDGRPVIVSKSLRIQYKKKRSSLVITKVKAEDAGRYECRATSVTGEVSSTWSTLTVTTSTTATEPNTNFQILFGTACPKDLVNSYCLNGGTCTFFEAVGELVCQCAEGYKGQRCESKDVYNRSSMYRPMSYYCKLGISSTYYC